MIYFAINNIKVQLYTNYRKASIKQKLIVLSDVLSRKYLKMQFNT